ncbi:DNA-binding transcriptional LysR family regulator [Luteibacter sp. Sphag1AF]|uniref:LysR substrate-binding domain-containing protein n=1 Tax=Luteibacter sp. Sphag1AF TaxID=2587031 RepID=UPI00180FA733|nr:LysR substrate-binding domain-containing protein [Luteibacter sp. Sphag1AF]MBB3228218.1 DNA-binding transcriptional LysR family regulator [Luteibacter sp. Sphag1AF]
MTLKLSQIRDVVAIADGGSLRAAAQNLGLAQPALTRSIREVEHDLGVELFERLPRGMRLTPAGEVFVRRMRSIQAELQRSRDEIDQLKGLTIGQLTIGLSMASTIALLSGALAPFKARYPGVKLKIVEGLFPGLRRQIADGDLDFYVGPVAEVPLPREFVLEQLFTNERLVLGRVGHPMAHASSLAELADASWIGSALTEHREDELGLVFSTRGLPPPRVEVETSSALSTMMVAANSDLLAMLPRQYLRHPGAVDLLMPIPIRERLAAPAICLVRRAALPLPPAAEFFTDLIRRTAVHEARTRAE